MILAATRGGYDIGHDITSGGPVRDLIFILVGLAVLVGFIFVARFVAHLVGEQLRRRQVRSDMVVFGRRAATAHVILLGLLAAPGFAVHSAHMPLFGLRLAPVVAASGLLALLTAVVSAHHG